LDLRRKSQKSAQASHAAPDLSSGLVKVKSIVFGNAFLFFVALGTDSFRFMGHFKPCSEIRKQLAGLVYIYDSPGTHLFLRVFYIGQKLSNMSSIR
jgi:hypothetical protein